MDSNRNNLKNQKITMALFFIKDNNETQLFNKWTIFIGKRYLVGRKDSDINIDNPLISRRHLEITFYTFNQIKVKDLGSRNGTYINNGKATPNQEIKFTSKDKLSIGDINNKIVFLENQEIKNSVFNNPINENIDQKNSESTKIINTNNNNNNINKRRNQYNTSNNRYNRYINNRYRYKNRIRQRFIKRDNNYKQRAQSFRKSPIQKSKGRDIYTDYYFDSLSDDIDKTPLTNHNKSYSNKNLNKSYDRYLKKEIEEKKNELLGKKLERNRSKNDERKHLVKLFKNKKIGLEKLKKKLKSIENDSEEEDEEEDDEEENEIDIIDLDEKIGNKKEKIILKSKKLNNLEFVVNANDKNIKKLKKVKQIKYIVNGYLVLNVKKKKLIYDE